MRSTEEVRIINYLNSLTYKAPKTLINNYLQLVYRIDWYLSRAEEERN